MLGWLFVVNLPVTKLADTKLPPATLAPVIFPLTLKLVNTPTLVILGWLFPVTVTAVVVDPAEVAYVALATVPTTLAPFKFVNPLPLPVTPPADIILPVVILPLTASEDNVPVLVILGWACVVNTPVRKLAETLLPPAIFPLVIFPLTLKLVNTPTPVILGWLPVVTVPAVVAEPALVAYVALATLPITLLPDSWDKLLPLPIKYDATILPVAVKTLLA